MPENTENQRKKAIVFAGGGSKGAYQAGAWKALEELGEHFDIATGTSIGSINAAMYVQHDFEAAWQLWNTITVEEIMTNGINMDKSVEAIFSQRDQLIPFLKNFINQKGADVTPFHKKLDEYFDAGKFFCSDIDYALVTVHYPSFAPRTVYKKEMQRLGEDAWKWLAASGACYPVFPPMNVEGEDYVDGGYFDNIPVAPAFKLGAEEALVIDLKPDKNHAGYLHHPRIKYIKPSRDLGTFLNFDKDALQFSLKLGYNDTMKAYGRYMGRLYTFVPSADSPAQVEWLADCFMDLLTEAEAGFDFSGSVKAKERVNNLEGCTTLLASSLGVFRPTEPELFFEALESLLRQLGFDPDTVYDFSSFLYKLKTEVDGMYPMLEYETETAFEVVRSFIRNYRKSKNPEHKKLEDDRVMLIYTSLIRALQKAENL